MMNNHGVLLQGSRVLGVCLLIGSYQVMAAEPMTASEAEQLRFEIQQLKLINENQARMLREMEVRLYRLESPQTAQSQGQSRPAQTAAVAEQRRKEAAPSSSVENILQEEHALFTDKFTFELGMNYTHYDRKDLVLEGFLALDAIFLGDIAVDDVKADLFTVDMTGRYNVNDRWQLGINLPYVYRTTNFQRNVSGGVEASVDEAGIGDLTLMSAYQLYAENENRPDIVWNLNIKVPTGSDPYGTPTTTKTASNGDDITYPTELPTGSGLWSISNSLSFVKTTDPAILFANVGYTYNLAGSFDDIGSSPGNQPGDVRLGDSFFYGLGMAFAMNERMSVSLSLSHRISTESETRAAGGKWTKVIGSDGNAATFNTGVTYALSDKLSMSTTLGIGLTPDAPDFSIGIKFPYRF